MAPQIRLRAAAVAVLAAAPAFAVGVLAAGSGLQAEAATTGSGMQVVFNGGGLLGLSCAARPDSRSITVPANSTLLVVNRTGYRARLMLDGVTQGEIQNSASAQVLFRRGPVTLSLKPSCVLSEESKTVRVSVTAAPLVPDEPAPAPDDPRPAPAPSPSAGAVGGGLPDAGGQPGAAGSGGLPNTGPGVQRSTGAGLPDSGLSAGSGTRPAGPAAAGRRMIVPGMPPGMPPGDDPLAVPGAPVLDPPSTVDTPVHSVNAEPVAALDPLTETGPIGLLAIVATVCAAGVTAGAIRAITAQRAYRARIV